MAGATFGRWSLILGAAVVLAACQDSGRSRDVVGASPTFAQAGVRTTNRDVEAPSVFERNETGLWDGRPSLGGVWVAHPDVDTPERVTITNQANGKAIVGALFRRERANPGPRIQVSSDAASQLGILAGQPTMLRVVALKRIEELEPAPAETTAQTTDPQATAQTTAPQAADVAAATGATLAATAESTASAEPQPVAEDAPPTSLRRRRQAAPADAPAPAAAGQGDPGATVAEAPLAAPAPAPAAAPAAPAAAAATTAVLVDDAALADPQPVAEDAPPTSFGRRRARPEAATAETAALGEDISVAPLDATAAAPTAAIRFPYIQAATFGSEANANAAAERLRGSGAPAEVRRSGSVWRVLAGPVGSAAEQSRLLASVKGLGYPDAYPVRD